MRLARGVTRVLLRVVLLLVLVEGTASWLGFALNLPSGIAAPERERLHVQYDSELGWAHVPGTKLQNFYGTGRHLTISQQGFRATRGLSPEPDEHRSRAVCAGGEFTLGIGVGDADTWCARLGARESGLETINMGQGGYGLDQSFLWYRREGANLGTQLLIFAFTREGFARMERETYGSYGKPILRLASSGSLQARNVPVPRAAESLPWLARNSKLFEQLRIFELARPAFSAFLEPDTQQLTTGELTELSVEVFEALNDMTREQGASLVLVYLPTRDDYGARRDLWRRRIAQEARARGIPLIDLAEEQNRLATDEIEELYTWSAGAPPSRDAPVLTEAGHAWVARELSVQLRQLPEIVAALDPNARAIP